MASSTSPNPEDLRHIGLFRIDKSLRQHVFRLLLPWVNPQWRSDIEEFAKYLVRIKKINNEEEFKAKYKNERETIQRDPFGRSWDITLLYWAIKKYNDNLAEEKNQDAWTKESHELEYLITKVKNDRNIVCHMGEELDEPTFKEHCLNSRDNLVDLLFRVSQRYKHIPQKLINENIDKVRVFINGIMNSPVDGSDFDPSEYEDYKKKMAKNKDCIRIDGKEDLMKRYRDRRRNCLEVPSYLPLNKDLPIEDTFVDMQLCNEVSGKEACVNTRLHKNANGKGTHIRVKNLIDSLNEVYYLEGRAGAGKTSLVKYLFMFWTNKKGEIKDLEEFDIFLHLSCREHIRSFEQLLRHSMPTVVDKMSIDTLLSALYGIRTIIVIDGYDERNKYSAQVLDETVALQKEYHFTLIVTGRPEVTGQFRDLTNSHGIRMKHVKVLGIPKSKRKEFLEKYARSMDYKDDIMPLVKYVEKTGLRLSDLWELPYNLSIIAILWMNDSSAIDSITTSSELHWQMHQTDKAKLKQRLLSYSDTKQLPPSVLERKVENFMYVLCEISLKTLANNDITLSNELYERLVKKCEDIEIPAEEMVGTFLKPSQSGTGIRYSYPHKGVIDFFAALHIHKRLHLQSESSGDRGPLALEGRKIRKILDEVEEEEKSNDDDDDDDKDDNDDDDIDYDDDDQQQKLQQHQQQQQQQLPQHKQQQYQHWQQPYNQQQQQQQKQQHQQPHQQQVQQLQQLQQLQLHQIQKQPHQNMQLQPIQQQNLEQQQQWQQQAKQQELQLQHLQQQLHLQQQHLQQQLQQQQQQLLQSQRQQQQWHQQRQQQQNQHQQQPHHDQQQHQHQQLQLQLQQLQIQQLQQQNQQQQQQHWQQEQLQQLQHQQQELQLQHLQQQQQLQLQNRQLQYFQQQLQQQQQEQYPLYHQQQQQQQVRQHQQQQHQPQLLQKHQRRRQQFKKKFSKYHNMLISLIGILYKEEKSGRVFKSAKIEALQLLRDTGVEQNDHWLRLLNDVNCDESVTNFIFQETDVLKGKIRINDGNLFAYLSLFRTFKAPVSDDSIEIDVNITERYPEIENLLSLINNIKLQVTTLVIYDKNIDIFERMLAKQKTRFRNPEKIFVIVGMLKERRSMVNLMKELKNNDLHVRDLSLICDFNSSSITAMNIEDKDDFTEVNEILQGCEEYVGIWNSKLKIPSHMRVLRVRLVDNVKCDDFFVSLTAAKELRDLMISIGVDINPSIMNIPNWIKEFYVNIVDIKDEEDARKACDIIRRFDREINAI